MLEINHSSPQSETQSYSSSPASTEWRPDIVIYHFPCDDGFGSAMACYAKYGDSIQYVGAKYGDAPPDVQGKNVLICDFSYREDVLQKMACLAASVVVLDHHKTAEEALFKYAVSDRDLVNINNIQLELDACADTELTLPLVALFDMERSGAGITWDFLFPRQSRPLMIDLLEDRDLWRFTDRRTKPFTMFLRANPFDLPHWYGLMAGMESDHIRQNYLMQGHAILAYHDNKVRELLEQVIWGEIGGLSVPIVNANWCFSSDVGHELLQKYPDAPFAATYFDRYDGKRQFSLRSDNDRVCRMDVSAIAKIYGGGGHRNAAGFEALAGFYLSPPEVMGTNQ